MSGLALLQTGFQESVLGAENRPGAYLVGTAKASAKVRLGINRDAYRLRLTEALAENDPALKALLGDLKFTRCARAFIAAHPSTHFSIRWFGGHLAGFLAAEDPYSEQPILAEMARFEWALRNAFDAADHNVMTVEEVAAVPPAAWPAMRIRLHPSVQRLDLRWNAPAIWKAIDEGMDPEKPAPAAYPVGWVVWRRELHQYFRSLQVTEAWALDEVLAGADFARIREGLGEWLDPANVAQQAASLLKTWTGEHMVGGLEV